MEKPSRKYLQGFLGAMIEVADVTGKQPLEGMTDREWQLICAIEARLARVASDYANSLEN